VEEFGTSQQTLNLVRDQFEINYFGPLSIIKAALPHMRKQKTGHIMILSGISKSSAVMLQARYIVTNKE
jgi:NADP-dependent 3-hydroxy acid dehydrogenase YdfG